MRSFGRRLKGVFYARSDDGKLLPVLDITHPAFSVETDRGDAEAVEDAVRIEGRLFAGLGVPVRSGPMRVASALQSYRAKLGDDALGWTRWLRFMRSADGLLAVEIRWRANAIARLLAAGMVPLLARRPDVPLHLVNVAGGAATDSLNALILLARDRPLLLAGRAIHVHVLDIDPSGPHFAARALAELRGPGGLLSGIDAQLEHVAYDWGKPGPLAELLARWREGDAVLAGSSEGGLFEYCPDELVLAHLELLRAGTPRGFVMAGSAWRDDEAARAARPLRFRDQPVRAHTRESLATLADRGGWTVQWSQGASPLYHVFLLRPR